MSKRELNRIDVLAWLDGRGLTTLAAADLGQPAAAPSVVKRYRAGGAPAIANQRPLPIAYVRRTETYRYARV